LLRAESVQEDGAVILVDDGDAMGESSTLILTDLTSGDADWYSSSSPMLEDSAGYRSTFVAIGGISTDVMRMGVSFFPDGRSSSNDKVPSEFREFRQDSFDSFDSILQFGCQWAFRKIKSYRHWYLL
jgi:hypothetical protein